jgi:hypothetical protein
VPDEPDPSQPGWAAPTQPSPPQPSPPEPPAPPPPGAPAPPTVQPAPPGWGVPPPPGRPDRPRRRRRWPLVLGLVLGSIVVLSIGGAVLFVTKVKPPIDATNEFLAAIEADEFDAAFDELCSVDQDEFTPDGLETLFGLGFLDDYSVNPFDVDLNGDRAKVSFDAEGTGDTDYFEITLRKEDGDWRVCLSDDPDFQDLGGS